MEAVKAGFDRSDLEKPMGEARNEAFSHGYAR